MNQRTLVIFEPYHFALLAGQTSQLSSEIS